MLPRAGEEGGGGGRFWKSVNQFSKSLLLSPHSPSSCPSHCRLESSAQLSYGLMSSHVELWYLEYAQHLPQIFKLSFLISDMKFPEWRFGCLHWVRLARKWIFPSPTRKPTQAQTRTRTVRNESQTNCSNWLFKDNCLVCPVSKKVWKVNQVFLPWRRKKCAHLLCILLSIEYIRCR